MRDFTTELSSIVIDGFMIQGGDPNTKTDEVFKYGTGGPGYQFQMSISRVNC